VPGLRKTRMSARRGWVLALVGLTAPTASGKVEASTMPDSREKAAVELMEGFAERTGLTSQRPQRRYLWTDSFAVGNFLGLARSTGGERFERLALKLVDRVHHVLGQHRGDDPRSGWISGLRGAEAEDHPTLGGLRIGKRLPERGPGDPPDERLEWDRDGQYFHYLAKWMQALDLVARSTREPRFNRWARELAERAHAAFTYRPLAGGRSRMYWKMSIDLSRPLVSSMGQHDPLDGLVTFTQLRTTALGMAGSPEGPLLDGALADLASMTEGREWTTADPLGIGGLLMDAYRVQQLMRQGAPVDGDLLEEMLEAALAGLTHYARQGELERPAATRLAFRELGLAIGLQAVERMRRGVEQGAGRGQEVRGRLDALMSHDSLRGEIERFWLEPRHRRAESWREHLDINEVMLATSLAPDGFLELPSLD
jgi:hypothetical protein